MKRKRGKPKNWKRIRRSLKKIAVSFFVVAFFASVAQMGGTNAGFLDEEKSEGNLFSVTTLDSSVSSAGDFSPEISPSMETLRAVSIVKDGLSNFKYRVSAVNFSGDAGFCDKLEIKDDLGGTFGDLDNYVSSDTDNSIKTNWNFTVKLTDNDDSLADKTCGFDLKFEAWQEDFAYGAGGFIDDEILASQIDSEHWTNIADHLVVNEVYYDVDDSHGTEPDNEWVEIYNPTSSVVNIKDWKICDNMGCVDLASADLEIPANGYAVVTKDASTWGFWTVPGSAVKIVLGTTVGNGGLSNTDDRLILKDDSGVEIDAMSYGTDVTRLNPACPDVLPGHSLARHPAGQDLNINSDFENLSSPNPGTNPHTVMMNEIMPDPIGEDDADMPGGEWVELYNYGEYEIDLKDWKLKDGDGNILEIKDGNSDSGSVSIDGGERLVIYRNGDDHFDLDNSGGEVSLIDEKDLIKDAYAFKETPEGKSIARFPDAVGPWIDPEATPGEENKLGESELDDFRLLTFGKCFDKKGGLGKKSKEEICELEFLRYLGMIKDFDDKKIDGKMELKILELTLEKEKQELADLAKETEGMIAGQNILDENISQSAETGEQQDNVKAGVAVAEEITGEENGEMASPKVISKEFKIDLKGKLDVPELFLAEIDQKMKKIELSGEEKAIKGLKDFKIDLAKIKIDKAGKIEIIISDLDLPKDIELTDAKKDDAVLLITVTEKPKEDPKKEEKISEKADATVPSEDEIKVEEKKDDLGDDKDDGDENKDGGADNSVPKSVDSAIK